MDKIVVLRSLGQIISQACHFSCIQLFQVHQSDVIIGASVMLRRLLAVPVGIKSQLQGLGNQGNENLLAFWALGDELRIPKLQNKLLRIFHDSQKKFNFICDTAIPYIYLFTGEGSLLRKYIVEYCAFGTDEAAFNTAPESFCKDFLLDYAFFVTRNKRIIRDNPFDISKVFVAT